MQDHQQKPDDKAPSPISILLEDMSARKDSHEPDRQKIMQAALNLVPFDGWTPLMMERAARNAGLDSRELSILFPAGVLDLLDFWHSEADEVMLGKMLNNDFNILKIRDKITKSLQFKLEYLAPHKEATRRAAATLALPHFAPKGAKLTWRSADRIWRALGDSSVDFNYYSKRTILSGVWATTLTKWLADDSETYESTLTFLDERIANVMQIEKWKADWRKRDINPGRTLKEGLLPALAKLRYPAK